MYLYHHLGLGDHLICFGLVKEILKKHSNINLFCKDKYYESVNFLYKDENKINIVQVDEENLGEYYKENNIDYLKDVIYVGFEKSAELQTIMSFDEAFYYIFNIDFQKKYENFYLNRDIESEKKIFEQYQVKKNEYVFVHDDKERGYNIPIYGKNIVRPNFLITKNIFDYLYLIENAKEIHCIESCFFVMIDFLINHKEIYYYINARGDYSLMFQNQGNGDYAHPKYQKKWKIIK
jgi:hypothetical protein